MGKTAAMIDLAVGAWICVALALAAVVFGGCASNGVTVREVTYYESGAVQSELVVKQKTLATMGSTQAEGAGEFRYEADAESFVMEAGAAAKDQQSENPVPDVLRAVTPELVDLAGVILD